MTSLHIYDIIMKEPAMVIAIALIPVTVITGMCILSLKNDVEVLTNIIARQHNLNPTELKQYKVDRLPFVRRDIVINKVSFDSQGRGTILFTDTTINVQYRQIGCPTLVNRIGKKYHVDYNTKSDQYAIGCSKFKDGTNG